MVRETYDDVPRHTVLKIKPWTLTSTILMRATLFNLNPGDGNDILSTIPSGKVRLEMKFRAPILHTTTLTHTKTLFKWRVSCLTYTIKYVILWCVAFRTATLMGFQVFYTPSLVHSQHAPHPHPMGAHWLALILEKDGKATLLKYCQSYGRNPFLCLFSFWKCEASNTWRPM